MRVTQPIRALIRFVTSVVTASVFVFALSWGVAAQTTEIIDSTGDGGGNFLDDTYAVAVDSGGNVYLTGAQTDNAFKIGPGGTITEIIDSTGDGSGNSLDYPDGIAVDSSGNVYVTGAFSDNAFKITPGGTITEIIDLTGDTGGNGLNQPEGVAVDSSGNVYVTGVLSDNAFKIVTPGTCSTGGTACTIREIIDSSGDPGVDPLERPVGVAVDSTSGNVYVTGSFTNNVFKIVTPSTCSTGGTPCAITEIIDYDGDGVGNTLLWTVGVAVDTSGNVYVTGQLDDTAFKIEPGGAITKIIDSAGDGGANTLNGPYGVAVDSSDNVYVTGRESDNAFKIEPGGAITKIIDLTGDGGGNILDRPVGIAVYSGGVYVTGSDSDNAFEITPEPVYGASLSSAITFTADDTIAASTTRVFTLQTPASIDLDKPPISGSVAASSATVTVWIGPDVGGFSDFWVTSGAGQFVSYLWDLVTIPISSVNVLSGTGSIEWATGAIDFEGNVDVTAAGFDNITAHAFGSATKTSNTQVVIATSSQATEFLAPDVPSTGTLALWAIACGLLLTGTVALAMRLRESTWA